MQGRIKTANTLHIGRESYDKMIDKNPELMAKLMPLVNKNWAYSGVTISTKRGKTSKIAFDALCKLWCEV